MVKLINSMPDLTGSVKSMPDEGACVQKLISMFTRHPGKL